MSKKKTIRQRTERVSVDAVTHETSVLVLDAVQVGFERASRAVESACAQMPTTASAPWYALVEEAKHLLAMLEAGDPVPDVVEPLATIVREWRALDPLHAPRFTAKLWERFRVMQPHTDAA